MSIILASSPLLNYLNNIGALHIFIKMIHTRFIILLSKLQKMVSRVFTEEVVKIFTITEIGIKENRTT